MEPVAVLRLLVEAQGVVETQNQLRRLELEAKRVSDSTDRMGTSFNGAERHTRSFRTVMTGLGPIILKVSAGMLTLGAAAGVVAGAFGAVALGAAAFGSLAIGVGAVALATKSLIGTAKDMGPLYQAAQTLKKSFQSAFDTAIKPMIGPLRQVFTQLPQMITALTPLLRGMYSALAGWLTPLMQGINILARTLLPALSAMFRATTSLIKPLLQGVSQFLAGVLNGITKLLSAAGPAIHIFTQALGMLGKTIGAVFSALAPAIRPLMVLFRALAGVLLTVLPAISGFIASLAKGLAPILPSVLKLLSQLAAILLRVLAVALRALLPPFLQLVKAILVPLIPVLQRLMPSITALAKLMGQGLVLAVKLLAPVLGVIVKILGGALLWAFRATVTAIDAVVTVVNGIPGFFKSAFYLVRKYVFDAIVAVLGVFTTLIHAAAAVFDVLSNIPGIGGTFGKLRDAANSTADSIDHFRNHLVTLNEQADQTAKDAAAKLRFTQARKNVDAATTAIQNNWTALKLNTGGTNQDILNNFTTTWKFLKTRTLSASGAVRDQATHDLNVLKQNVAGIMTLMLSNVTSQMDKIKGVVHGRSVNIAVQADKDFRAFAHNVWKGVNAGWLSTRDAAKLINGALIAELNAFASATIPQAKLAARNVTAFQRGGMVKKAASGLLQIGREGARGQDNVPLNLGGTAVMAAEGEQIAVINRHQQGFLNKMLAPLGGLPGFFQKFNRPHAMAEGGFVPMASGGLAAAIGEANAINAQHYPYVWGGGHNSTFSGPYDCSGAVSAVLHAGGWLSAPEVSGALANFGASGPGPVTVYANTTHTFMSLLGRFFGTHGADGAGWYAGSPLPGYAVRHPSGPGTSLTIPTPHVDDGGTMGKIAQGVINKMAKAANAYALKNMIPASVAPGPGGPAGYTISQLEGYWTRNSGPGSAARIAAAIAMAESGGRNVMQQGQPPGTTGWGLWQITPTSGIPGGPYLLNPNTNAQKAVQLYNQAGGFSPWVTYNDGAYRAFMQRGGLLPPYGGSYADGGIVPGPLGAPRMIIAHGGETVSRSDGPLITIQEMNVNDSFDEQVLAHRLAFLVER